ncbi:cob(I)yrinic acid a,c-diamide adenosyltransferase [Celerinatantimonas diazotrophica]|uniref:Corrinoid adenosyltransferase n=1 Tax=Celerinatantimonas diazotrophica TaxID=412034 RepID=A0A4R1JM92_9GAMM|nr:cob(I)yrinic acid a,c-diamide adenosyltransferase [Celerinatantimonas diazotrophica]TCK52194.1 cob(I)yrinic acid a,c-diamide adenosyltransferase [Celerinatantimonas diazotrophica]CAG9296101.1 Corrinoid adenosyltransferase [Celerinatantimonas diazotrophica]
MSQIDNERHQKRQQKLKMQVDERIRQAQQERGLLIVLTGNGKGKSTSGFGTIARAVGHGQKAAVVQFIKGNWECGERDLLSMHGVKFAVMATGFTWETQNKEADQASAQTIWQQAKQMLADPSIDVVLLDELTYMISYHYLDLNEVITAIEQRPESMSVIITGRGAHRRLIDMADTVSEIQSRKHAFDNGLKARKGIDW